MTRQRWPGGVFSLHSFFLAVGFFSGLLDFCVNVDLTKRNTTVNAEEGFLAFHSSSISVLAMKSFPGTTHLPTKSIAQSMLNTQESNVTRAYSRQALHAMPKVRDVQLFVATLTHFLVVFFLPDNGNKRSCKVYNAKPSNHMTMKIEQFRTTLHTNTVKQGVRRSPR